MENLAITRENKTKNWKEKFEVVYSKYEIVYSENQQLHSEKQRLEKEIELYKQQILLLNSRAFGKKSEKHAPIDGQMCLFNEAEEYANPKACEPDLEKITYTRKKAKNKRNIDISQLPVEQIKFELSEEDRVCPKCNTTMQRIGEEVAHSEIKIIPAKVVLVQHITTTYACKECEKNGETATIIKATTPTPVIKGGLASPSLVAYTMADKYVNAMPLYRQEQDFKRQGIDISKQTMSNWIIAATNDWLEPLYKRLIKELLLNKVLHADETTMQVLKEEGKTPQSKSYLWEYRTSSNTDKQVVIYEYQKDRKHYHPQEFLKSFTGYLHTDGYEAYHKLPDEIIPVGCFAHLRRKYEDAYKIVPKEMRDNTPSSVALGMIQKLFLLEKKYKDLTDIERYNARLENSKPIFDAFYKWIEQNPTPPKTPLGKAHHYALSQKKYLENVFLDGRCELSNNRAERGIRPFTIGRKNWLFSITPRGATTSAIVYSIVQTAIENKLNPYKYLEYLFEELPNSTEKIENFFPWSEKVKEKCMIKPKTTPEE